LKKTINTNGMSISLSVAAFGPVESFAMTDGKPRWYLHCYMDHCTEDV
jgi:hypothetical protein